MVVIAMDSVSDNLNWSLTEEELQELLADLPNVIRDLEEIAQRKGFK